MQLKDFQFNLPEHLIARYPVKHRSESRLMNLIGEGTRHQIFRDIVENIQPGDLLVFNDTKVLNARLFGHKKTGGKVEIFIERLLGTQKILVQLRASKAMKNGDEIKCGDYHLVVTDIAPPFYQMTLKENLPIKEVLNQLGELPLPPYLGRAPEQEDLERYQTIYAKHEGSVAAPTAGLHFDHDLLESLRLKGVQFGFLTLHIGAGTFKPVRTDDITKHTMHQEFYQIDETLVQQIQITKAQGNKVIAVGTTSLRALESAAQNGLQATSTETQIFIYPGFNFQVVDALITNLHLPGSTLLMLVAAFSGQARIMSAYQEAVRHEYRFFSYGDAMFLSKLCT